MIFRESTSTKGPESRLRSRGVWRALHSRLTSVVRVIVGAPDYDAYLAHMRRRHPDSVPLGLAAFERELLSSRQRRPGARCC